ncbi:unnamed protein product, partial [Amoebophrya sp. A25]
IQWSEGRQRKGSVVVLAGCTTSWFAFSSIRELKIITELLLTRLSSRSSLAPSLLFLLVSISVILISLKVVLPFRSDYLFSIEMLLTLKSPR